MLDLPVCEAGQVPDAQPGEEVQGLPPSDTVGFSQYPYGSDPDDPFINVLAGANLEFIHHMAEIALLRDLYRAGQGAFQRVNPVT
ncbi:hypothetical protein ACWD25_57150 [Streptomyces sp. NPDC002920]